MEDIIFIGDWIKDRVLGSGSFGVVVLWKHKKTDEKLAIKTCKWGDELTEKHKERWTKEVDMLLNCNNPNIVSTKELPPEFVAGLAPANQSKLPILCMEFCSGGDLRQVLNRAESCSGIPELQVRQVLGDVRNAIQFLHNHKITHRDLKPENIVMQTLELPGRTDPTSQNQRKVVYKLIDLGYAKEIDSNSVCASFVGTLQYLAPEILYSKSYSNSVDYWSLGLLAFELICGVRPFLPNMAPMQWMPHVKKKCSDHICVYETFHGDIEYSSEIFPENQICKPFRMLIEKWLKIALEWDPKLRGRDTPSKVTFKLPSEESESSSKVIIFNVLEEILSRKIVYVFSIATFDYLAYEIYDSTTVASLKSLIAEDTKISLEDQILISQRTYTEAPQDAAIRDYWNENCATAFYLYSKTCLVKDNLEPSVPKSVQRSLEHPKALYNFNNSQVLYKNGLRFVIAQMELYDSLISGLFVRAESLKQESKLLLLKHNAVDKSIGKLLAKQEIIANMIEMGKNHFEHLKENGTGLHCLGGFHKIFSDADDLREKVLKLQSAWTHLTIRLQSAARRSNEVSAAELNNFVTKNNYHGVYISAQKIYLLYRKTEKEYRIKEKQCHDIMKVCYDTLKLRSRILHEIQHQPYVLKMMDLSMEFGKINGVIATASENTDKLLSTLNEVSEQLTQCIWSTISLLSGDVEVLNDLPYSVVSFEKRDFRIGDNVSSHNSKTDYSKTDSEFRSLIEDSLKIRQNYLNLTNGLKSQKNILNETSFDFDYLKE